MSFEWNLSSDEEDLEEWARREGFAPPVPGEEGEGVASAKTDDESDSDKASLSVACRSVAQAKGWNNDIFGNNGGQDDDEESYVDWEDAEEQDEADVGTTPPSSRTVEISLRPVTIHMGKKRKEDPDEKSTSRANKKKRRKGTRRVLRQDSLPKKLQSMLCNLQRTHLLTLTSHACFVSRVCSNLELMAMSHSIIPSDMITAFFKGEKKPKSCVATAAAVGGTVSTIDDKQQHNINIMAAPTINELKTFCQFYFDLVHRADYRLQARRAANVAAGAPRYHTTTTTRRSSRSRRQQQQCSANASNNKAACNITQVLSALANELTSLAECPENRLLEYVRFLAYSTRDDPQLNEMNMINNNNNQNRRGTDWTVHDQNQLFIGMTRSLGWRTRFVQSMDPIKSDLDVNHPLLMTCANIFRMLATSKNNNSSNTNKNKKAAASGKKRQRICTSHGGGTDGKKRASTAINSGTPTLQDDHHDDDDDDDHGGDMSSNANMENISSIGITWCEVLCRDPTAPSKLRWIMVDPAHQLVNLPDQVEIRLTTTMNSNSMEADNTSRSQRSKKIASNKRTTIAYALAVEHVAKQQQHEQLEQDDSVLRVRFTDVTPRYAESHTESLQLRGMLGRSSRGKRVLLTEEELAKTWWATTLRKLNHPGKEEESVKGKKKAIGGGSSAGDAILLLDDDDNDNSDKNKKSSTSNDDDDSVDSDLDKKMPAVERHGENEHEEQQQSLDDVLDRDEHVELKKSANNESIPTSKNAFRTHPVYVIPSVLGVAEVVDPTAKKRMCGVFKGELVYRRQEVSTALVAKKWLYQGRQVRSNELAKPIKRVKARKKPISKNFKALKSYGIGASNDGSEQHRYEIIRNASQPLEENDGMDNLYAHWQTNPWSPTPVGPTDAIPVNEYKNIERDLLNPGLVHIDAHGVAAVAKKLSIPYAPCLLGFEGHGGNRTPTIRGIVVHAHNEAIMREASAEVTCHTMQQEQDSRRRTALQRWKKLFVGLLTKDRLDREYGGQEEEDDDKDE